jgi:two-component sensor histidine kinase
MSAVAGTTPLDSLLRQTHTMVLGNYQKQALRILVPLYYSNLSEENRDDSFQELVYQFARIMERTNQHEEALRVCDRWLNDGSFNDYYKARLMMVEALVYEKIGSAKEALTALKGAENLISKKEWPEVHAEFLIRMSSFHRVLGYADSARIYALWALPVASQIGNSWHIGDSYLLLSFTDSTVKGKVQNMKLALKAYKAIQDTAGIGSSYLNLFYQLFKAGELAKARTYLDSAKRYVQTQNFIELRSGYYADLAFYMEQTGRFREALDAYKKSSDLGDSADENARAALLYSEKYKLQYNQQLELVAMRVRNEQEQKNLVEERNKLLLFVFIILVLLSTTIYLYWIKRRQGRVILEDKLTIENRNAELEKLLERNDLLLNELQHRVKNNLQFIISMISLQVESSQVPKIKEALEAVLGRVGAIAAVHEKLFITDENTALLNQSTYIHNILSNLRMLLEAESIDIEFNAEDVWLDTQQSIALGLIVTELVTNSMKHAFADYSQITSRKIKVDLTLNGKKKEVYLRYEDNGKGLTEKVGEGLGSDLIKMFARQLKGDIEINAEKGFGFAMRFSA